MIDNIDLQHRLNKLENELQKSKVITGKHQKLLLMQSAAIVQLQMGFQELLRELPELEDAAVHRIDAAMAEAKNELYSAFHKDNPEWQQ